MYKFSDYISSVVVDYQMWILHLDYIWEIQHDWQSCWLGLKRLQCREVILSEVISTHCDQSLLFFHLINQRFVSALAHNSMCVQNIKTRIELFAAGIEPVHKEKLCYLVKRSNDWAILTFFVYTSILAYLRAIQKNGGKIY